MFVCVWLLWLLMQCTATDGTAFAVGTAASPSSRAVISSNGGPPDLLFVAVACIVLSISTVVQFLARPAGWHWTLACGVCMVVCEAIGVVGYAIHPGTPYRGVLAVGVSVQALSVAVFYTGVAVRQLQVRAFDRQPDRPLGRV